LEYLRMAALMGACLSEWTHRQRWETKTYKDKLTVPFTINIQDITAVETR